MKVHFTKNSEKNLSKIHIYHRDYSLDYADSFYDDITDFILKNLSQHPKIGHIYNAEKGIYRLVFMGRYNVYYLLQDDMVFILYILDGRVSFNITLSTSDANIPALD